MKVRAGVIEIANRVKTNAADEGIAGVAGDLAHHQSGLNANAHQLSNIAGLQAALNSKEPAFSKNNAFNKSFGTIAGSVCEGNDSRLSDARTPTAHTHDVSDIVGLPTGITQDLEVVVEVDFVNQTVTTATVKVVDGIITEIN